MKIAIVHEWLVTYAGSERALEQIVKLYPDADLFSLIDFLPDGERGFILNKKVNTSFMQNLPSAKKRYRSYLPLMPFAIRRFDMSPYDLIISSSHAVAKGVKTKPGQLHVCYCYTPMRYAWDLHDQYLEETGLDKGIKGVAAKAVLSYIRKWDYKVSKQVDHYIAISDYISERIKRTYGRDSTVIYPPVDINGAEPYAKKDDFYLAVSRMVPYKKMDLIVEAFSKMPDKKLIVIGDGSDLNKVKAKATDNIDLLGYQPKDTLKDYMKRAKAFIFAADEDFGIVTIEAQSFGTPVIAYGKGGSLETVLENETGIFFNEQSVNSLVKAVKRFESECNFDYNRIRKNSERFAIDRFRQEFRDFIYQKTNNIT
jgi:glycosyltransferase involved in cell wall biosynthesis